MFRKLYMLQSFKLVNQQINFTSIFASLHIWRAFEFHTRFNSKCFWPGICFCLFCWMTSHNLMVKLHILLKTCFVGSFWKWVKPKDNRQCHFLSCCGLVTLYSLKSQEGTKYNQMSNVKCQIITFRLLWRPM